jgi:hypothetical protein
MLRNLMFGAAALALIAFAGPAGAQVALPDVELEGPMTRVVAYEAATQDSTGRRVIGEMTVMGVPIKVLETALVHTPTAASTDVESAIAALHGFSDQAPRLQGRSTNGFIGGTAIVIGESIGGVVYASDVFSDFAENVIVGEATAPVLVNEQVSRATINNVIIRRITDARMPGAPATNGLGLRIDATQINPGTLVAAEGYYSPNQNTLWYHHLEADDAPLANTTETQVGILRADCRVRGGGRDEIQVRGGVAIPGNASVQIRIPSPTAANPNRFVSIGAVAAVPIAGSNPPQGQYDADFRNLTIPGGVCPSRVRAVVLEGNLGATRTATATADMAGR